MRPLKLLESLRFWRTGEDVAHSEETAPLISKGNSGTRTAVFVSSDGEEVCDGKVWEEEAAGGTPWSCDWVLRWLLFMSTLLCCMVGLLALLLGLWGLLEKESLVQERVGQLGADPMLALGCAGLALALLCLCGCVGVLRQNACLLRAFSAALLALLTAQVLLAVATYALYGDLQAYLRSAMLLAIAGYQDDLDLRFITDELQTGLQCCGADSYRDWEINKYFNCSGPGVQACGVPPSCCVWPLENGTVWNSQCGVGALRLDEFSAQAVVFLGGCLGGISRWVERNSGAMAMAGVVLLGVQVLALLISSRLLQQIQRSKSQH